MSNVHRVMAIEEVVKRPANNKEIIANFWQEAERLQQESKYDIAAGLLVIEKCSKEAETKTWQSGTTTGTEDRTYWICTVPYKIGPKN